MSAKQTAERIKMLAAELGFERCGIARAEPIGRSDYLRLWLAAGRAGSMDYLHRYLDQRIDPRRLLNGARSVVVVAQVYNQPCSAETSQGGGRVAMYAWGRDYHKVLRRKLWRLVDGLREQAGERFEARVCVDTAPVLEREAAAAAGIGWIGKNTLVLHQDLGSYFFLGAILTTLELPADEPVGDHCGTCTACLDACPTGAFPAPHQMDASRCISYLTIERRGELAKEFQAKIGDWVFGCDVCQQVCPFNRNAPATRESQYLEQRAGPFLNVHEVLQWSDQDYRSRLSGSAAKRATLDMLRRNAKIVLANAAPKSPWIPAGSHQKDPGRVVAQAWVGVEYMHRRCRLRTRAGRKTAVQIAERAVHLEADPGNRPDAHEDDQGQHDRVFRHGRPVFRAEKPSCENHGANHFAFPHMRCHRRAPIRLVRWYIYRPQYPQKQITRKANERANCMPFCPTVK